MIEPCRAAVRPRFIDPDTGASMPLEFEIANLVESNPRGLIGIIGGAGSGKTTALKHLAALLPAECNARFWDVENTKKKGVIEPPAAKGCVIYAARRRLPAYKHLATLELAPWDVDECIEYLHARHPEQCGSVMRRVMAAPDRDFLEGLPALWRVALDQFATDVALTICEHALKQHLDSCFDTVERAAAREFSVFMMLGYPHRVESTAAHAIFKSLTEARRNGEFVEQFKLLQFHQAWLLLAAELIVEKLSQHDGSFLMPNFKADLVRRVGLKLQGSQHALDYLRGQFDSPILDRHPMAASILYFADDAWRPDIRRSKTYFGGIFPRARWPNAVLNAAEFMRADLSGADLSGAELKLAKLSFANLHAAQLSGAQMASAQVMSANLSGANLSAVSAEAVNFAESNCVAANFKSANLLEAKFINANLQRASFVVANLTAANLTFAKIVGADFTGAILDGAILKKLPLNTACFNRARFEGADLTECDLSGMKLERTNFKNAKLIDAELTGSAFPDGNFAGADLSGARLAEIEWPNANLAGAVLYKITFHMGSTRAGLLFSPIASEGSKTGFYTDEYYEQGFKAPEQIRKANLRGADLRGAKTAGVDFYLVDLRDALYDEDQKLWFKKCGALL